MSTERENGIYNGNGERAIENKSDRLLPSGELKSTPALPWASQVDAIASSLHEKRSSRTYQVKVEAVLDNKNVQITPAWNDIPSGVEVKLTK